MPIADAIALSKDMTLRGELFRTLKERFDSPDMRERNVVAMAIRIGLAALDGRDLTVFLPKDEQNEEDEMEVGETDE